MKTYTDADFILLQVPRCVFSSRFPNRNAFSKYYTAFVHSRGKLSAAILIFHAPPTFCSDKLSNLGLRFQNGHKTFEQYVFVIISWADISQWKCNCVSHGPLHDAKAVLSRMLLGKGIPACCSIGSALPCCVSL